MSAKSSKKKSNGLISASSIEYLQFRIQEEEMSSRIYLAMSMWLENKGFVNAPKLWRKYSKEELTHAEWSRDYLLALGVTPEVPALKEVPVEYKDLPDIIQQSYDHEIEITIQLKELAKHSLQEGDYMLHTLALKYLTEQIEEHDKTTKWMDQVKTFGTDPVAIRLLDNSMKDSL